jgi:hypothetical protein
MVKILLLLLAFAFAFAQEIEEDTLLVQKIKTLVDASVYKKNEAYIKVIFSPISNYYINDKVDIVKVAQALENNGLLKLFFSGPQKLRLSFKTSGSPILFVKIMSESLRNIGYYRYGTIESSLNDSEFTWTIGLTSEYATNPTVLQKELSKSGCNIIEIQRNSSTDWSYTVDIQGSSLNITTLQDAETFELKRSLDAHWLNVSKIKKLKITSSKRNNWYPYIAYYDRTLHLLEVLKKENEASTITLDMPSDAKYIKIADTYTMKNIKDDLILKPIGTR